MLRRMTALRFRSMSTAFCEPFNVRFGSLADLFTDTRLMSAFGGKADVDQLRASCSRFPSGESPDVRAGPQGLTVHGMGPTDSTLAPDDPHVRFQMAGPQPDRQQGLLIGLHRMTRF